jgi:phosphatidate cytidylyltransferase
MIARVLSSLVLIPVFVALFFLPDARPYLVLVALAVGMGFLEYRGILKRQGLDVPLVLGLVGVALWLLVQVPAALLPQPLSLVPSAIAPEWLAPGLFILFLAYEVWRYRQREGVLSLWAGVFGLAYVAGLGGTILRLRLVPQGSWWTFLLYFFSWVYDGGAYFAGKALGKTPLTAVSPSKTVEGLVGGVLASLVLSLLLLPHLLPASFPLRGFHLALASLVSSGLAQTGDLAESLLKRYAQVKDSGWFIRFGGILDKLDSPFFVAPFLYWLSSLAPRP